jgi:hypothetical protein
MTEKKGIYEIRPVRKVPPEYKKRDTSSERFTSNSSYLGNIQSTKKKRLSYDSFGWIAKNYQ